jgi:hypothetical protein
VPSIAGIDWYLFDPVPEPATSFIVLLAGAAVLQRRFEGDRHA